MRPPMKYEWQGKLYTVKELAELSGLPVTTVYQRLTNWKSMEQVLFAPLHYGGLKEDGQFYTIGKITKMTGLNSGVIKDRLKAGWTIKKIIETPLRKRRKSSDSATKKLTGSGT